MSTLLQDLDLSAPEAQQILYDTIYDAGTFKCILVLTVIACSTIVSMIFVSSFGGHTYLSVLLGALWMLYLGAGFFAFSTLWFLSGLAVFWSRLYQ